MLMDKGMQVISHTGIDRFNRLKNDWETVYDSDDSANIFLSWSWLKGWLSVSPYQWQILSVHPKGDGLPLAFMVIAKDAGKWGSMLLQMGGTPQADYTGLICTKGCEKSVFKALTAYFAEDPHWDVICFKDLYEPRMAPFLVDFQKERFHVSMDKGTCCPQVLLPGSWKTYLRNCLGPKTRQTLLRKRRRLYEVRNFNISSTTQGNFDKQIWSLICLWDQRFGHGGEDMREQFYSIHKSCLKGNLLWLDVMRIGKSPVTALSAFLDYKKNAFCFYIMGFNPKFSAYSPGKLMVLHAIEYAIRMGFSVYDFMRGDEPYKYSFGATVRNNYNLTIRRRSGPF